jgi:hypothetical protein
VLIAPGAEAWGHQRMVVLNHPSAVRGAQWLVGSALLSALMWVLQVVGMRFLPTGVPESAFAAFELGWVVMSAVLIVAALLLAGAVDRPGALWALAAAVGLSTALSLGMAVMRAVEWGSSPLLSLLGVPSLLLNLVERGLFLWCAVSLAGSAQRAWTVPVAFVDAAMALFRFGLSAVLTLGPLLNLSGWYPTVSAGIGLVGLAAHVVLSIGVLVGVKATTPAGSTPVPGVAVSPVSDFVVGGVLLLIGLVVSVGSYAMASSSTSGGRYVVATGAIAVGVGRLIRGAIRATRSA